MKNLIIIRGMLVIIGIIFLLSSIYFAIRGENPISFMVFGFALVSIVVENILVGEE